VEKILEDSTTSFSPSHTTMPIPIIATGLREGISAIPHVWTFLRIAPWVLALFVFKYYFEGTRNTSERMMRSKVIMVTVRPLNIPQHLPSSISTLNPKHHLTNNTRAEPPA
jgi:hypothetical protein